MLTLSEIVVTPPPPPPPPPPQLNIVVFGIFAPLDVPFVHFLPSVEHKPEIARPTSRQPFTYVIGKQDFWSSVNKKGCFSAFWWLCNCLWFKCFACTVHFTAPVSIHCQTTIFYLSWPHSFVLLHYSSVPTYKQLGDHGDLWRIVSVSHCECSISKSS